MASPKKSLRVYFVTHGNGHLTGTLMRTKDFFFDRPPPAAYGPDEETVLWEIEQHLLARVIAREDAIERHLWDESFEPRAVTLELHPFSVVKKQPVIGKKVIPLRVTYVHSKLANGAYRIMLPRFSWWFIVEALPVAKKAIENAVCTALLGEDPRWMYDFRHEGREYVREWAPASLLKRTAEPARPTTDEDLFPSVSAVAEEWVELSARGKLPPVVGAGDTVAPPERDTPPSLLLVGPSGVGKTTWVRRLAKEYASRRKGPRPVPRIWATSAQRIIAGMVYLGMWQERCIKIVDDLAHEGDYLFVDRLTGILERQSDGASIADILAPAAIGESISLIAECDDSELERCRRVHPALISSFTIVRLREPAGSDLPRLMADYQSRTKGKPKVHPEGMKRLVQHLGAFSRNQAFPGKAFSFLDWLHKDAASSSGTLYPAEASRAYARYSGLSVELIAEEHPASAEHIAEQLRRGVVGQDHACMHAARVLARF